MSISIVEIMTKNLIAGCIRLCYSIVYLACMVLGLTLAPILYNAPGNTSGVGFQRLPMDMSKTCDTTRGIVVNKFWLLLCVPIYICAYNVYLKAITSRHSLYFAALTHLLLDSAQAMAHDAHCWVSRLWRWVRFKT